jgi:hypothetical protein
MRTPPPRSPELEALLAPHRTVSALAAPVEGRAIARAAAVVAAESWERGDRRMLGRPRWVFAAAAGVVLVLGAAAYAAHVWIGVPPSRPPVHVAPRATPVASVPRPPAVVPPAPQIPAQPTFSPPPPPRRRVASRASAATVLPTNAELQLLRAARQDVTRGDFADALAVIADHTRRFRNGGLVEEREALRVKSLAGMGRHEDARRAAAAFHARFPHSVFLSTFERMQEVDR